MVPPGEVVKRFWAFCFREDFFLAILGVVPEEVEEEEEEEEEVEGVRKEKKEGILPVGGGGVGEGRC